MISKKPKLQITFKTDDEEFYNIIEPFLWKNFDDTTFKIKRIFVFTSIFEVTAQVTVTFQKSQDFNYFKLMHPQFFLKSN